MAGPILVKKTREARNICLRRDPVADRPTLRIFHDITVRHNGLDNSVSVSNPD